MDDTAKLDRLPARAAREQIARVEGLLERWSPPRPRRARDGDRGCAGAARPLRRGSRADRRGARRQTTTARWPRSWPRMSSSRICCCCTACIPCRSNSACVARWRACCRIWVRTAASSNCSRSRTASCACAWRAAARAARPPAVTLKLAVEEAIFKAAPDVQRGARRGGRAAAVPAGCALLQLEVAAGLPRAEPWAPRDSC